MPATQMDMDTILARLRSVRIMPVLSIASVDTGLRLVDVLQEAGLEVLEITLRTPAALDIMAAVAKTRSGIFLGAGTVRSSEHLKQVTEAGARFAVSPGASIHLLEAAADASIPFIPGVATPSEAMTAKDYGFGVLKLFPAEAVGGQKLLKAMHAPLPDLLFCPTGGVNAANAPAYLALPNVFSVGGSWMVPDALLAEGRWAEIGALAKEAIEAVAGG